TCTGHDWGIWTLAFAPDSKTLATASGDGTVRLWEAPSGKEKGVLRHPPGAHVRAVTFAPDGKKLVSGSADGSVRLWDLEGMQQRGLVVGHKDVVFSVRRSPDGGTLASASKDERVRLWDLPQPQPQQMAAVPAPPME